VRIDRTLGPNLDQLCKPVVQATSGAVRSPLSGSTIRVIADYLCAQSGEPIRDLQALTGHARAKFILQRYTHHYEASVRRTADGIDEALG
jgi:hypothetical protein